MAITIPVTHAAKQKNSRRSPTSTGMFTPPPCSLCLTIFVGTGRNGNSLSIMGHESLQTSYPKMPALNSERSRSFGVNEAVARSAQDWRGFFVNFIPPPAFCKRAHGGLARRGALRRLANDVMLSKQG